MQSCLSHVWPLSVRIWAVRGRIKLKILNRWEFEVYWILVHPRGLEEESPVGDHPGALHECNTTGKSHHKSESRANLEQSGQLGNKWAWYSHWHLWAEWSIRWLNAYGLSAYLKEKKYLFPFCLWSVSTKIHFPAAVSLMLWCLDHGNNETVFHTLEIEHQILTLLSTA